MEEAVTYVDTDGDTIVFRHKATGKLDYHVNGAPKVIDLISLEFQDGCIRLDGTSTGSWPSQRCTKPMNFKDAWSNSERQTLGNAYGALCNRVLALYSGNLRVTPLLCRPFLLPNIF